MTRLTVVLAVCALCTGAAYANSAQECRMRLEDTLAVMQQRAPLPGRLATELMWLRKEAKEARQNEDIQNCLKKVRIVEGLLGMPAERR